MRARSIPAGVNAIASQAISSVRSFAFLILAARALSPGQFGFVAIVTTAAIAFNEVLRALASHPLALAFDDASIDDDEPLAGAVSLHVLLAGTVGLLGAAVVLAVLLAIGSTGGGSLVAGCVVYGFVAWLDALRTGSINRGRADRSVVIDALWTLLLLVVLPLALAESATAMTAVLVWGLSAGLAAGATAFHLRLPLSVPSATSFWQRARSVAGPLATQVGLESVPTRLAPLVIAAMVGAEVAGSIRGAEVLLGGAAMVYSGIAAAALRRARSLVVDESVKASAIGVARSFGIVLLAVVFNIVVVAVLPDRVGEAVLGDSWSGAAEIAPLQALLLASLVLFAAVSVLMRAMLAMGALVRIDALGALLAVVVVPSATAWGGPELGLASISLVVLSMTALGLRSIQRSAQASLAV